MDQNLQPLLETQDFYKDFIQNIKKILLTDVCIILGEDVSPNLKKYVRLLLNIKYEDGRYHAYYGEIKKIVNSFVIYFTYAIDEVIKEADEHSNLEEKEDILVLIDRTIDFHQISQVEFGKEYLPVKSAAEREIYEDIEKRYLAFMDALVELRDKVERFDKHVSIKDFTKEHFKMTLSKRHNLFNFSHRYIGLILANHLYRIRSSLEEILTRMRTNLRKLQDDCNETLHRLLHQLYDKNKEHLIISRSERKTSTDTAEVNRCIQMIREKIEDHPNEVPLARLTEELKYWEGRLHDFKNIEDAYMKLKVEQDNVIKQEQVYKDMRSTELPGSRYKCWENMGENFKNRKAYLEEKMTDVMKTLITFFSVRGTDRIMYTDNKGNYYVDEYNHQVYVFDYGMAYYHINCDGQFREVSDAQVYQFDERGRYVLDKNGEKIYQLAQCSSQYKLQDNELLQKITEDCGHSERANKQCSFDIKDPTDVEILPRRDLLDIRQTLDGEVVKYLWDSFGSILPDALHDVGRARPKNPIHYLAHRLLYHKYSSTISQLKKKAQDAEDYRSKIYQDRKDKAVAASKAWKSKQVKRRKPEESDDAEERAVYDAYQASLQHIMNYYNN